MRTAYRGRAAAYENKGEHGKAVADHTMAVTYFAIEIELLTELNAPDRAKVLAEAAEAYLARSRCLEALGKAAAAQADRKRAADLQAQAKAQSTADTVADDHVRIINAWASPVSVVIEGVTHRIDTGARKDIRLPAGSAACRVQAGPYLQTATLRAGRSYTIR